MHAGLRDGMSSAEREHENLGADQRAGAPQIHALEYAPFEQFKSAIDVLELDVEQRADQPGPTPCVKPPDQIFPTVEAVATDAVASSHHRQKRRQLAQIELAVAVGVEDQRFRSRTNARSDGGAVTQIPRVVD